MELMKRFDHKEATIIEKIAWIQWGKTIKFSKPKSWYLVIRIPFTTKND